MKQSSYNNVENILVPHTSFVLATNEILQCFRMAESSSEPICKALLGESRAGKTRILEYVESKYPSYRTAKGLRIPILRITVPPDPSIKGLAEEILTALGDPKPDKGTAPSMTKRIIKMVKAVDTKMMMVDEFQHFYSKEKHVVMHKVADWLKVLVDKCKIALIVSGLESSQNVLNLNEQLAGRFMASILVPRYEWTNDTLRDDFISILAAFQKGLKDFSLPALDSDEMAFRFYCASGGLIGYVAKVLHKAVCNAVDAHKQQIMLEDFSIAYQQALYKDQQDLNMPNPFDRGFIVQVNEDLLRRVRLIGTPKPEEPKPRRSRNKEMTPTVAEVLHT